MRRLQKAREWKMFEREKIALQKKKKSYEKNTNINIF